jgi:IclR family transcriptional regulator, blcABC operon repressor
MAWLPTTPLPGALTEGGADTRDVDSRLRSRAGNNGAMSRRPPEYFNRATHRTMRVLEVLASASGPVPLTELSRQVEVSKSSIYSIVRTLVTDGYLDLVGDGYQLTARTAVLARPEMDRARLLEAFYALVRSSALASLETVVLSVVSGRSAIVIAEHPASDRPVQLSVPVGTQLPLHASASGKALISMWPSDAIHIALGSQVLPTLTERTTSSLAALLDELEGIRRNGMAESWGEMDAGVVSAAIGVGSGHNLPRAAVAVVVPIHRAEPAYWSTTKDRLRSLAQQLERGLA